MNDGGSCKIHLIQDSLENNSKGDLADGAHHANSPQRIDSHCRKKARFTPNTVNHDRVYKRRKHYGVGKVLEIHCTTEHFPVLRSLQ